MPKITEKRIQEIEDRIDGMKGRIEGENRQSQLPDKEDMRTLLQVDGTVIAGVLIFLTVSSSINTSNQSEQISLRLFLSIIAAVVVTPFVVSALYAFVAIYSWRKLPGDRERYVHRSYRAALFGTSYIAVSIVWSVVVMYYSNYTEGFRQHLAIDGFVVPTIDLAVGGLLVVGLAPGVIVVRKRSMN